MKCASLEFAVQTIDNPDGPRDNWCGLSDVARIPQ
jgi:hypothetical protein